MSREMLWYDRKGWGLVPALDAWKCPDCGTTSPIEDWRESEGYCEDCGEVGHDVRICPVCDASYDYVWDDAKLAAAQTVTPHDGGA